MFQRKLVAGIHGLRTTRQNLESTAQASSAAATSAARRIGSLLAVYAAIIAIVVSCWLTADVTITTPQMMGVQLQVCHNLSGYAANRTAASEVPSSLAIKLLAVYLAHDVDLVTHQPQYRPRGSVGTDTAADRDARRIWTHTQCDPDGDGLIDDCDVSAPWKYRRQLTQWLQLDARLPNPYNPSRHVVPPGEYRFVVLQVCLENLGPAAIFAVQGGMMEVPHRWSIRGRDSCMQLARPLLTPLVGKHGDDVIISLWYTLERTFRTKPLGSESPPEWECFNVGQTDQYCARMPAIQPVFSFRSKDDTFSLSAVPLSALCLPAEAQQLAALHQEADADGSGEVSEQEFDALRVSLIEDGRLPRFRSGIRLSELDASRDALLSLQELWDWAGLDVTAG